MGFQGSMIVTRGTPKDYVLLSTNQSKNLLSGGRMCCNKDAATFWRPALNETTEPPVHVQPPSKDVVLGKDINEWIKQFVENEFFHNKNVNNNSDNSNSDNNNNDNNNNVDMVVNKHESTETTKTDSVKDDNDNTQDEEINEKSDINDPECECNENDDDNDNDVNYINDESRAGKTKKKNKVFKFMKNAIKRHMKK